MSEARSLVLAECMAASGFPASPAELAGGDVPTRFDGESYLMRLYGDATTSTPEIAFDDALQIAEQFSSGNYPTDHSCTDIADAVAPIRALGVDRAELLAGSDANEVDAMARLLSDPRYVAADAVWRDCLAAHGIDDSSFEIMDDLLSELDSLESFTATTDPAAVGSQAYLAAVGELPGLRAADADCNPPFETATGDVLADLSATSDG